jgi:hypothetical protein
MSPYDGCRQLAWTIALACLIAPTSLLLAQSSELPAGPVQAKVQTACMECHDSHIIMQQRLSNKAWTKEVDKMIKWGALVDPNDRNAFIDYLSTNFSPEKAAEPGERVGSGKTKH